MSCYSSPLYSIYSLFTCAYRALGTGINMKPETTCRIARDFPNVVAVKEASGSLEQVDEIINISMRFVLYYSNTQRFSEFLGTESHPGCWPCPSRKEAVSRSRVRIRCEEPTRNGAYQDTTQATRGSSRARQCGR